MNINIKMQRTHIYTFIICILFLSSIISASVIINRYNNNNDMNGYGTISGVIFDAHSQRGIVNELAVSLRRVGEYDRTIFWPNDSKNPGYYEFTKIEPGNYNLLFTRSWQKVYINDPNRTSIEGGWVCPDSDIFSIHPGDDISLNFSFSFYAYYSDVGIVKKNSVMGDHQTILYYNDWAIFADDSNLIGKQMTFTISWENSLASRCDCTIEVLSNYYSEELQYGIGQNTEQLTVEITDEFVKQIQENDDFTWRVTTRYLPSFQLNDIDVSINWTITNP